MFCCPSELVPNLKHQRLLKLLGCQKASHQFRSGAEVLHSIHQSVCRASSASHWPCKLELPRRTVREGTEQCCLAVGLVHEHIRDREETKLHLNKTFKHTKNKNWNVSLKRLGCITFLKINSYYL